MSHHIYHTRGIILESQPRGESNRYYKIFTEELGLIWAAAQAVREGKSKLRYVLQDTSIIFIDLVRGKEVWRITSASEEKPLHIIGGPEQKKLFVGVCAFASRLLQGEGREDSLFVDIWSLSTFLMKEVVPGALFPALEALTSLRLLFTLGYFDAAGHEAFLNPGDYSLELIDKFSLIQSKIMPLINNAIVESQL